MDNDPFRIIFIKYLILQIKKTSVTCTIYSAKVSDLLHCLYSLAIKTLKANLTCPVTGLTVRVLKILSKRYVWKCWMDFACPGQACYGWMVPQMDSLMLPGAAGLTVRESCNALLYLQPAVCWLRSLKQLEQFASGHPLLVKSFPYLSRKHGVDWALGLIISVEYKQLASADWALPLYCTYSPILVMFFQELIGTSVFIHAYLTLTLERVSKTDFVIVCFL